jgi:hypothetical protein
MIRIAITAEAFNAFDSVSYCRFAWSASNPIPTPTASASSGSRPASSTACVTCATPAKSYSGVILKLVKLKAKREL